MSGSKKIKKEKKEKNLEVKHGKFTKITILDLTENTTFMIELNSKISSLKKEIFDRSSMTDMVIYWKDKDGGRIDIKVDSDVIAFMAEGNGKIFVDMPRIRTADDFALEMEYAEYARENMFY